MLYLKSFYLPSLSEEESNNSGSHEYPYGIFPFKDLRSLDFSPITIIYGSNGSGKSTLLNLIAEKLNILRSTPFNASAKFYEYVENKCDFCTQADGKNEQINIPHGSRIITSEDIFNNILTTREKNKLREQKRKQKEKEYFEAKYTKIQFNSLDELDMLKTQNDARKKTASSFINERIDKKIEQFSNGETSLSYYNETFEAKNMYLLDEPENSLSPLFQLELAKMIIENRRYFECQFIIATHSPFFLAMEDTQIYDLDSLPVKQKNWYELDNMKLYYQLFKNSGNLFEKK